MAGQGEIGGRKAPPSDALQNVQQELATRTKTALAQATATAAEQAAGQPPLPVLSTSHLRELTSAASRVFGWDNAAPQVTHNQLVITQEQLERIRALRDKTTPREDEEASRRLMTPEGQEELRRNTRELLGREQNMEQQTLPTPSQANMVVTPPKVNAPRGFGF